MKRHQSHLGPLCLGAIIAALATAGCQPTTTEPDVPLDLRGDPIVSSSPTATNDPALAAPSLTIPTPSGDPEDPLLVGFDLLAGYEFDETAAVTAGTNGPSLIPENLRALSGRSVAVKGFMLPLRIEQGRVTELLLMRDQSMCCFGVMPRMNDWISVKFTGEGVRSIMDQPVTILGTLHVGEQFEKGLLLSLYRLDGERLLEALDL